MTESSNSKNENLMLRDYFDICDPISTIFILLAWQYFSYDTH